MAVLAGRFPRARTLRVKAPMLAAVSFVPLLALAALWLLPLAWIALTGLKPEPEIIRLPIRWMPVHATTENFGIALTTTRTANVGRAFFNSAFVAVAAVGVLEPLAFVGLAAIPFAAPPLRLVATRADPRRFVTAD